ncbi:MAG: AtpZ/AtpI family protein [Planctomycetota bacterium]|nr:AtpZ/AtpI family protein [Planctomycetota bacterium]
MFEIGTIRAQLNELAFHDGKRAVVIGLVADLFPDKSSTEVETEIKHLEERLRKHDLLLARSREEADELYAVQTLKYRETDLTWMASGIQWVAKITTVALEMVVPGAIGMWLDQKLETHFLGVLGIILGVPLGIWHLVKMTKR